MKEKNPTLLWKVIAAVLAVALIAVSCTWAITANNRQTATKPSPTTYTVKSGDCLSAIAKKLGLNGWNSLYSSNKKLIGTNPNRIYPGQKLVIPS